MNTQGILSDLVRGLEKVVDSFEEALKAISTGKPTYEQISSIEVDAYGSKMSMSSVATFTFESPTVVVVNIFDKSIKNEVYKAVQDAKLGVSIQDNGSNLRLTFRPLTEEDKKERAKELGEVTESFKVRVRLLRQDANSSVKSDESIREDDKSNLFDQIQAKVDDIVKKIDNIAENKRIQILN